MGKRTLSFLIALVMVIGMIPVTAAPVVLATEQEQPAAVYDAAVAAAVTVDGKLDEIDWRTSGKLSGGQPFDILWDGDNLYFAAVADGALTVKIGDEVIATAEKAEGAAAIEAKVAHSNYGVTVLENVTLAVGESTWTGNVKLVKMARVESFNFDEMTSGSQSAAGAVTKAADGKGIVFDIPAIEAANKKVDTLYSMKWNPIALAERTDDVALEFTMDIEAMTNISDRTGTVGVNNAVWAGMDVILADDLGEALRFAIGNNADKGLFMNVVRGATLLGAIDLGKTVDADPFSVKILWKADRSMEVFVDGVSKGVVEDATISDADMGKTSYTNNHMVHIRATRYDYQFEYYKEALKFTVTDVKMSKTVKVTYSSGEAAKDGKMVALFVNAAPNMEHIGWDNAGWEGFMAGEGQVSALIYNTHVYLAVKGAGEGTVTAKLGEETETAELVEGAAILCFDETAVSLYGQTLPLQVNIGGQDAWPEGELTVGQAIAGNKALIPAASALVKAPVVTVEGETISIVTTDATPMYDAKNCAYWIQNNRGGMIAANYDPERDNLLEQTIKIEAMSRGDQTGTYALGVPHQGFGYTIMFEIPSVKVSNKFDFFSCVIYPDEEQNLLLTAVNSEGKLSDPVALGKKIGDEFKLGLNCGIDDAMTVYVDGAEVAKLAKTRYTSGKVYGAPTIMLKYMDPITQTAGNGVNMTVKDVTITNAGTKDLVDLEEEITVAGIFKGVDLKAVKANLTLPTTFKSAYLGEHKLSWKSSDESVIESNGTIHPHLTKDKKATLSVFLDDATKALWSVEVTLPATAVVLNALLSEEAVVVDGKLTENAWIEWEKFDDVSGNIAALWTKGYLFLGIHSAEGETLKLEINGVAAEVDLVKGTITGYAGAQIVKNKRTGEIEIGIPLTAINFNLTDYNQTVSLKAELVKGETVATLEAILLNFSGDVAALRPLANYTKDNGPWTLLTNSISYNGNPPGKVNYAYKTDNNLDLTEGIVLSQEFCFEHLPITDGAFEKTSTQGNGFYYYFTDEDKTTRNGTTIAASIFTTDGTNLKMRISGGQGAEGTVIDLGRTLGETFRVTHVWHPDKSMDLFVDGVLVATIAKAGIATSYLGIDVITYRYYSAKVSNDKVKFTIADQAWATTKYENVMGELTPNVVFGRTDLEHVQEDLPMVTAFASANFAALNLKWTTSDPSVVTADGKITRHATEAKSAEVTVYFIDAEGNETKLWSVTITVDPLSVTKQPAPAITHTAFTAPGTVAIDGILDDEGWLFNGWMLNAAQQEVVSYGAMWDQNNLYLALDINEKNIDTNLVVLNVGGKTLNIDLATGFTYGDLAGAKTVINGDLIEIRMPAEQVLGIEKITEYNLEVALKITMGDVAGATTLRLSNVDWWATDTVHFGLPMLANNVKSVKMGTADTPDGNQGAKQLVNGYRLYDVYDPDGTNPAGIRTYVLFMKMPVYENFADRSEATHLEFDFYAKALPVWNWAEAIEGGINRAFATYGVTFSLSDKADANKNSNVAVFGIVNTTEGLQFVVNRGAEDYFAIPLNKQVGEEFRLGLTWETDSDMVIWIDGEIYTTVSGLSRWVGSVGDTSFVVNMLRNKQKPTSSADDMDVYLTNIAFGKAYTFENLISKLTFDDIRGKNEAENAIESDLILPTYMTNGQLDHQYPITWTSSDEATIDPTTGKVTCPETGVKAVTLTATLDNNGTKEVKEFNLLVLGKGIANGNAMIVYNDTNPFKGAASENATLLFDLDKTNNSIVYVFAEGETPKANLVVLTDLDEVARLNRESLRLFVSNDNVTYTEIEEYKLHHDGLNWYLYNFETDAKYIKVHYTHRDQDDANFTNTAGEMIHAYWNDGLVIPADAAEIDVPKTTLLDQAAAIKLPEGIKAEGLHVALNGEILFHYVDKDGTVYVRIADPTTGKLQLWNSDLELADKENVYEVTYGTRETLPTGGRWVLSVKAGTKFPDGSSVDVDTLYTMGSKSVSKSTDGGYSWTHVGSIIIDGTGLSSGGWGIDSKTGRMFHESYGDVTFNETDITKSHLITYVHYSDDGGKTWTLAEGLGQIEGDLQTMYVLSYTDLTELAGNDGEGPNVDFVFPMGAQFNNNGAFCGRVAYTKDGGLSWSYSESKITYGNETAFEGGVSEATILEREDGTLVYYARCQSGGVDNFTISYSLDHGVTWLTPGATSTVYTTNTQALMMTYDFGGFDGNRLTGTPMFMWGGNNVMGGNSYIRNPLNFAISTNGMDTFRNIQNIFFETFMEEYKTTHYITNASIQQINGDDMYVTFSRLKHSDSIYMVVNDFTDWFLRTKGAYDSFEHGTAQYEGWITVKGGAEASKAYASAGKYSMLVKANSQVTRSVPYLQDGTLSIDLYIDGNSKFVFELQPAFAPIANKCTVIGVSVEGTALTLTDGTKLTLKEGWNTVSFGLNLTKDAATIAVNGGEAQAIAVNVAVGDYIGYITFLPTADVYVDELLIESGLDVVTEATEEDKAAADEVIDMIKNLSDAASIEAAKKAYAALSQVQQDLVNRRVPTGKSTNANAEGALINYYEVLMNAQPAEVKWISASTTLGGDIGLNFYVQMSASLAEADDTFVRFTIAGKTIDVAIADARKVGDEYVFTCPVNAKSMTDKVVAQVMSGETAVGEAKSMDVVTYCEFMIANSTNAELVALMKAMLNYGAAAQVLFNYNVDKLANASLSEADKALADVDASAYAAQITGEEAGIALASASLMLETETSIRIYFKLTGDKAIGDYTFTVDGVEVKPIEKNGEYYVEITDIAAQDLDKTYTIAVGGLSVKYSGLSYVNTVLKNADAAGEKLVNTAKALFAYNKLAEAYFN